MNEPLEYDARLEKCPLVLIKTKLLLKQLQSGQQLRLILGDSGSIQDIPRLLKMQGILFQQTEIKPHLIEIITFASLT